MSAPRPHPQGRRPITDHAAIERAAFALFEAQGFEQTTMEQIAAAVGVGRRTLFRYFPSKNDIPWGQFDQSLDQFRAQLDNIPDTVPISQAIHRCIISFNDFDEASLDQHRVRMRLILSTPALQAHSALRYTAWREVIADYVAQRKGLDAQDLVPNLLGRVSLALSLTAYEQWLDDPTASLRELLNEAMSTLKDYLTQE